MVARAVDYASSDALGTGVMCDCVTALLNNALGCYPMALIAAERAHRYSRELGIATLVLPELIEAASRCGQTGRALLALQELAESTQGSVTDWALSMQARSRAVVSEGTVAEACYQEAIERLGRTGVRVELARAHLLYGEWLRRENRRHDARVQLRSAVEIFSSTGSKAFLERSYRELMATGETVRKRRDETRYELTSQEAEIARLAGSGYTNTEIGTELFISPRTVEWHLRKVYTKLGVCSRRQLRTALGVGQARAVAMSSSVAP
jgi:ATP/maltotriose-dependent transcriptional regulator MalT